MISLANANSPWIPHTNSSDLSIPENTLLGMEDASSWKSTAGSPINLDTMSKDTAAAFDNEWFIAAPHEVLEQETAPTGILSLEALQLQSFLSPTSTMVINNHAQQQTQSQQQQSIVLDSDGSIMLDENGHIISSPVKKKHAGLTAMCSSPSPRKSSVSSPQTGSLNVFQHSTILKPLSPTPPCTGARPTLFQKRALSRSGGIFNPSVGLSKLLVKPGNCITPDEESPNITRDQNGLRRHLLFTGQAKANQQPLKSPLKRKAPEDDWDDMENTIDEDDESGDGSGVAHELGNGTKANTGSGNCMKSSKKGMPAKNLLAERRRRKKLNDRLYTLRSVVPKITKMDRASILGDAIEYLKELIQKIKDLHNELEAQNEKNSSNVNPQPLTPTSSTAQLRGLVKEESSASKPMEPSQPARIEVKMRDGKDFNIHMLCGTRPGLLLSMMKALDGLGLDVQQAVISCFNGFVFDIFRAEAMKEGEVGPEEIKTVLLHTAGCHSVIG